MDAPRHIFVAALAVSVMFIFVLKDTAQRFFFACGVLAVGYALFKKQQVTEKKRNNQDSFITSVEKELSDDHEVPENKIFYIHKSPRNLKYLRKHKELQQAVFDLKFLQIYDRALFNKMIIFIEYFLKIHFKVMIGKYEFSLYYPMLRDARSEILNTMKSAHLNIPNISTILYIKDIDDYLETRIRLVQAVTYKLMKLLCHKKRASKQPGTAATYKPPLDSDTSHDYHYALF
jgi:hypothetical protein